MPLSHMHKIIIRAFCWDADKCLQYSVRFNLAACWHKIPCVLCVNGTTMCNNMIKAMIASFGEFTRAKRSRIYIQTTESVKLGWNDIWRCVRDCSVIGRIHTKGLTAWGPISGLTQTIGSISWESEITGNIFLELDERSLEKTSLTELPATSMVYRTEVWYKAFLHVGFTFSYLHHVPRNVPKPDPCALHPSWNNR